VAQADDNLRKIDHIVVLMLENRSFDHMLGFLTIEQGRDDVEGPTLAMKNEYRGETFPVHPASRTTMTKAQDPCHSGWCVDEQLAHDSGGFVSNFMKTRKAGGANPGVVMAYHPAQHLPVYDFLAREFCVCDHWFCSVPGATMPNRCYAAAGTSNGLRDNINPSRPYNVPSFLRHLDDEDWRWYSHDYVPTIWLLDPEVGLSLENVPAFFDRRDFFGHRSFLERAAKGDLPPVSWIDPNFYDLTFGPAGSNDDHPPSDLRGGQKLVLQVVDALLQSRAWKKTLLVITYDEHGGFFDHVKPPAAADDRPSMRHYGPRVPAFVISPYVAAGSVGKTVFDHTSIIKDDPEALRRQGERLDAEDGRAGRRREASRRAADGVEAPRDQAAGLPVAPGRRGPLARGDGLGRRAAARRRARDPARADRLREGLPRREGRPARGAAAAGRCRQGGVLS
jgi:phospholipase C